MGLCIKPLVELIQGHTDGQAHVHMMLHRQIHVQVCAEDVWQQASSFQHNLETLYIASPCGVDRDRSKCMTYIKSEGRLKNANGFIADGTEGLSVRH